MREDNDPNSSSRKGPIRSKFSRRAVIRIGAGFVPALVTAWAAAAQSDDEVKLLMSVYVSGPLPGFRKMEAAKYIASRMSQPYVGNWSFAPGSGHPAASPNRVEWRFEQEAVAKNTDPEFAPEPSEGKPAGSHLISAELRLFIGNKYQTMIFNQSAVTGGPKDEVMAAFIVKMTQNLLGLTGAYHSIDRHWRPLP